MSKAMEDLWKQGVNEGIKQGIIIGEERVARRAALHLLLDKKRGYAIDEIAYISGLSVENVKKLKAENPLN